jgi:hypothetical protein
MIWFDQYIFHFQDWIKCSILVFPFNFSVRSDNIAFTISRKIQKRHTLIICLNYPFFHNPERHELLFLNEHEKNNELIRTKTNSGGVSSYRVRCVRCYFFLYQTDVKRCFYRLHQIQRPSTVRGVLSAFWS